jgi:CheY-like chemotaxis protein
LSDEPILIVDDNKANLKLVRVLLSSEDFDIRVAADAEEALAILASFHPSLILMDLQLPGMNGLALTTRLKADPGTRDIAIVALTANAMKGDDQKGYAAGCDGYVTKPIETRTLSRDIRRFLAERQARLLSLHDSAA